MTIELDSDQPGLQEQTVTILRELALAGKLGPGQIVVIGTSTSEVAGQKIGTSGAVDVAQQLLAGIREVQQEFGFEPVFQCCEHLDRALVMEGSLLTRLGLTEVGAVPVPKAGGSMASAAYRSLNDPCLAEHVQAHAGVDIGETMIGMHLRHVAVPFRTTLRYIGEARVTTALTRPKLIGGERAVYQMEEQPDSTFCD